MSPALRLTRPAAGSDLRHFFDALIGAGGLDTALDLSVVEFDELAQLAGITVTGVETSAAGVAVSYEVRWAAFHACDDRAFGGTHARVLRGRAEGGDWVFTPHMPWPTQRDVADEL